MENYAYGFVNCLYTVAADQPTDAERKEPTNSQREPEQCESDRESETEGKCQ